MIKFIHTADLHLGTSFSSSFLSAKKARRRRQDLLDTFEKIIKYGLEKEVDVFFLSGDLFEYKYADKFLINYIKDILKLTKTIPVFISPGNHDPVLKDSYYLSYKWPDNVHIFKNENWEKVYLSRPGINVYGLGWQRWHIEENLLNNLECEKDKINFVLLHADNKSENSTYLPIDLRMKNDRNITYMALGHVHQMEKIYSKKRLIAAYPGTPEPLDINEGGKHGFILGKVLDKNVELEFIPIAKRKYIKKEIILSEQDNYNTLREKLLKIFEDGKKDDIYRICLTGLIDTDFELDIELIKEEFIDKVFYLQILDKTEPSYNIAELKLTHQGDIIGIFIEDLNNKIENSSGRQKEIYQKALYYGLDALLSKKVILR